MSGVLPQFLQEKIPTMMGCDPGVLSPPGEQEELTSNSAMKRRCRRSLGGERTEAEFELVGLWVESARPAPFGVCVGSDHHHLVSAAASLVSDLYLVSVSRCRFGQWRSE